MYTISEVAEKTGIKPHTLRYYEEEGIMQSERTPSGIRRYTEQQVGWLRFILKLRETNMPVSQIKQYTHYVKEGDHTALDRLHLLEVHMQNIQQQMAELRETEAMLEKKVKMYKEMIHTTDTLK
ncbi:MerR family transcriptional regulator [Halobacillus litoralis]|uniref:MerR family transcriptional regulator n=1 Tax=Halobacillus litoralis TaxID=45668 RepID=UPI001CD5CBF9|nr:MerR family transcriptional regulator [Halobacillus litoralis]MCA0972117.1 MerR family transcriptional regulator [Halobacillus litoralis]